MSPEQAAGDTALDARTDIYSPRRRALRDAGGRAALHRADGAGDHRQAVHRAAAERRGGAADRAGGRGRGHPEGARPGAGRPVRHRRASSRARWHPASTAAAAPQSITRRAAGGRAARGTARSRVRARRCGLARPRLRPGPRAPVRLAPPARRGVRPGGAKLLAVLPFENLGGADDEYFADGVTDEVRGKLAALPGLQVTARRQLEPVQEARQRARRRSAGSWGWITSSPARCAGRRRAGQQPRPGEPGADPGLDRLDQVAAAVRRDAHGRLQGAGRRGRTGGAGARRGARHSQRAALAERPTTNGSAYDAYLKGEAISLGLGSPDPSAVRAAIGFYEQAVALDSGFAQAWAALSRAHSLIYANGTPSPQSERRAREAAERALRLAPNQAGGHLALGDYFASISPYQDSARQAYEAGLRVAPSNADLLGASALVEVSSGKWTEALAHFRRAEALDPRSVTISRRLAYTLIRLRRYPEAMAACDRAWPWPPTTRR